MSKIDIKKSIESDTIIYVNSIKKYTDVFFSLIILLSLLYLFSYEYFLEIDLNKSITLIIPLMVIAFCITLTYWYLINNRLKRKKNVLNETNKIVIEEYLHQLIAQREWHFLTNSENLKILDIPMWQVQIGWYNKLFLIYDDKDLLINFSSYGRGGTKLPFSYFCNRSMEKKIIEKIQKKINQ